MSALEFISDIDDVQQAIRERDKNIQCTLVEKALLFKKQTFTDGKAFARLNLGSALFSKCTFLNTELDFVRFRFATFIDCVFKDVTFHHCDFKRAKFSHCDVARCLFYMGGYEEYDIFNSDFRSCSWFFKPVP